MLSTTITRTIDMLKEEGEKTIAGWDVAAWNNPALAQAWRISLTLLFALMVTFLPESVLAANVSIGGSVGSVGGAGGGGGGGVAGAIKAFVSEVTGPVGSALATLGVVIVAIGALMGKVSWGMAIMVAVGIGAIFGAGKIVSILGG